MTTETDPNNYEDNNLDRHQRTVSIVRVSERRDRVAALYLNGRTQNEIAEELGVSQTTVCHDIQELKQEWQRHAIQSTDRHKAQELARLDFIEREAWQSWEESKVVRDSVVDIETPGGRKSSAKFGGGRRDGNPKYLEVVLKCVHKRCEILGLDAPSKQITLTKDISQLTDAEIALALQAYGIDPDAPVEQDPVE